MNILGQIMKKREMPMELDKLGKSTRKSMYTATLDMFPFVQINASVVVALLKYQAILDGTIPGGLAMDKNGRYLAEYYLDDEKTECAVYNPFNGSVMASIYNHGNMEDYDCDKEDMSLLILSLMEVILSDNEAKVAYDSISTFLSFPKEIKDWSDFSNQIGIISDNIVSRLKIQGKTYSIENNFSTITSVSKIPLNSFLSKTFEIETEFAGRIRAFKGQKMMAIKETDPEKFNGAYKFSNTVYKENMVAKISDSYYVPESILEICKLIKSSTNISPAFRDVLLYGDSGSGKTAGSYAIAAGLGMPYVTYTCHPQTDNFDLIGQFVPATGSGDSISIKEWLITNHLPTVEDVYSNPKETYKELTGRKRVSSVDTSEVISELFKKMLEKTQGTGSKKDFVFVPSEIIEALKNGYLCEIQEPTVILNEGVLVGLNAILAGGYIRLANGERVYRHPDSVIVFTTNSSDYAGYGKMSNSVLSRCSLVYKMDTPSIDEMVVRAMKKTGFSDQTLVTKMATCIVDIADKIKDSGVKDGVTGFRELINWISAYRVLNDIKKAAYPAVINKSTFDVELKDEVEDLIRTELDSF